MKDTTLDKISIACRRMDGRMRSKGHSDLIVRLSALVE